MDITLPLPQVIGSQEGVEKDGVLIGKVAKEDFAADAFYTHSHELTYAILQGDLDASPTTNVYYNITDALNELTATKIFDPDASSNTVTQTEFYLAVAEDVVKFNFNVTTAGVGTFTLGIYYNSPSGYILLPGATTSANFLKSTGLHYVEFTPPANWQEDYIGTPTPRERWLRITIDSGTVTTAPQLTGAWSYTEEIKDTTSGDDQPPFYNPYKNLLPQEGDTLYFTTPLKPFGMQFAYTEPMDGSEVSFIYSKVDGTFGDLTSFIVSDTSAGFTAENLISHDTAILTSTGTSAAAATVEAIPGNGYVEALVTDEPTAIDYQFTVGLGSGQTGSIEYEIRLAYDTFAEYQVWVNGVEEWTSTEDEFTFDQPIRIWRYNGSIYFFIGDTSVYNTSDISNGALLYGRFETSISGVVIDGIQLVDWSNTKAAPLILSITEDTDFTLTNNVAADIRYPAYYYVQFLFPTDFSSTTALLSKTGTAGYTIGVPSVGDATTNCKLMIEKMLTANSEDNVFFPTGVQTNLNNFVLDISELGDFSEDQKFLIVVKNTAGEFTRLATITYNDPPVSPLSTTVTTVGMTDVIIIDCGSDSMNVGFPAFIYLST